MNFNFNLKLEKLLFKKKLVKIRKMLFLSHFEGFRCIRR